MGKRTETEETQCFKVSFNEILSFFSIVVVVVGFFIILKGIVDRHL